MDFAYDDSTYQGRVEFVVVAARIPEPDTNVTRFLLEVILDSDPFPA